MKDKEMQQTLIKYRRRSLSYISVSVSRLMCEHGSDLSAFK